MQILTGLGRWPERMAFSPDGRYIAAGDDRSFHLWDVTGGAEPLWSRTGGYIEQNFAFTPDGAFVLGGAYGTFARYDTQTGAGTGESLGPTFYYSVFSPDGRFALAPGADHAAGVLRLRCVRDTLGGWEEVWLRERTFNTRYGWSGYRALLFSPDGTRFVRVYPNGPNQHNVSSTGIEALATATGDPLTVWTGELPSYVRQGAVSQAGTVVLLNNRALYAIDTTASDSLPVKRLNASQKHFTSAAFTRDGTRLATTSNDTAATIWDATTWDVRKRYEWDIGRLRTVCLAPDGLRCAAGSDTGRIVVWDLDD